MENHSHFNTQDQSCHYAATSPTSYSTCWWNVHDMDISKKFYGDILGGVFIAEITGITKNGQQS